jgi:hypothetical protein
VCNFFWSFFLGMGKRGESREEQSSSCHERDIFLRTIKKKSKVKDSSPRGRGRYVQHGPGRGSPGLETVKGSGGSVGRSQKLVAASKERLLGVGEGEEGDEKEE